jgi:hypothetical protein
VRQLLDSILDRASGVGDLVEVHGNENDTEFGPTHKPKRMKISRSGMEQEYARKSQHHALLLHRDAN